MPNILVTNDDGITAGGIAALVEVAREFGTVTVVAPDSPQSGQGHAITLKQPLRIKQSQIFSGIDAYECDGTPADCVKMAKYILFKDKDIDLCLSGINHGSNASINIIYSGTMSAAMEASIEGIPSIGFSLDDFSHEADFTASKKIVKSLLDKIFSNDLKPGLLNVNIPNIPYEDIKGMKVCQQGDGRWRENFQEGTDPHGNKYYWLRGHFQNDDGPSVNSDINALKDGYVSMVPSHHDLTHYASIDKLSYLNS
jgi:5'-nucleotidase